MGLFQILSDQTGSGKSNMAASKLKILTSQLLDEIEMKFQWARPTFSRSNISMGLVQILSDQTGSGNSNMAASKPEILISQLLDEIEMKC